MSGWSGITKAKHILLLHGVARLHTSKGGSTNMHASHTTHALIFSLQQHQTQSIRSPLGFTFPLSLLYIDTFARLGEVSLEVYT